MNVARFRHFVEALTRQLRDSGNDESRLFEETKEAFADLMRHDDWLPREFSVSSEEWYQQYLLYCDPWERFSVVSFAWDASQSSPVSDLNVWGMFGVLRGVLTLQEYSQVPGAYAWAPDNTVRLESGEVRLLDRCGRIFEFSNALNDGVSLSVHIFGANIAKVKRHVYDPKTGNRKKFFSRYSNPQVIRATHTRLKVLLQRVDVD